MDNPKLNWILLLMGNLTRKRYLWLILLLIVILFASLPGVRAAFIANLAMTRLLQAKPCDPEWFVCQALPDPYPLLVYPGNQPALEQARDSLEQALELNPGSASLHLHLAEVLFSLGEREAAARLLSETPAGKSNDSPLLDDNRYEARLLRAYQASAQGDWLVAVENFRLGLAWSDERSLASDDRAYFLALAALEDQALAGNPADLQARYRAGRYLAQAGQWQAAYDRLGDRQLRAALPPIQSGWTELTIGRYLEINGDWPGAIGAYRQALQVQPTLRQAYIRLLPLMYIASSANDIAAVENRLASLGPTYRLGAQGEAYQDFQPAALPGGWTLVGYDLDEEMLEQAKRLEVILWWQGQDKRPQGEGWLRAGDYWLQRQVVTNLFPNAGFEWGVDERGVPVGYKGEIYGAPESSYFLANKEFMGQMSSLFITENSPAVNRIALAAWPVPVSGQEYYLMSGWIFDSGNSYTMGRNCLTVDSDLTYNLERPSKQWNHYSEISLPLPGQTARLCDAILLAINSETPGNWDKLIWLRVNLPE
jgi:hypothetical protein